MYTVLLTVHILVTVFLIGIILMQRSASDGMGLTGGSSSGNILSGRAAASAVTHATAILATLFILTSLTLGILSARSHPGESSLIDRIDAKPTPAGSINMDTPVAPAPATPGTPAKPSVPRPQ